MSKAEQEQRRRALVPEIRYPDDLPVSQRRDDIAAAIRDHQVVIVAGETGSGKTTQLPKICLELGRGRVRDGRRLIGHTQPRRIAARSVAERIAEELGTELGEAVGYQVRFTDRTSAGHPGQADDRRHPARRAAARPDAAQYDTIIIDEAHERSLNIDFLLGYLRQLLPRRPDLKVVITSATIDPERFAGTSPTRTVWPRRSSRSPGGPTRSRSATGRWSRSPYDDEEGEPVVRDQTEAIVDAVRELVRRGTGRHPGVPARRAGDPRHRRRAGRASTRATRGGFEVVPLYSRLSAAEQHRVFERAQPAPRRAGHQRRRDLADRPRHPVRRRHRRGPDLALLGAHQGAAAADRADQPGLGQPAVRALRPGRGGHRDPALRRGGLRGAARSSPTPRSCAPTWPRVILQMTSLGLGDVGRFPFVEPPDQRNVTRRRPAARGARRARRPTAAAGRRAPRLDRRGRPAGWPGCRSTRGWAG